MPYYLEQYVNREVNGSIATGGVKQYDSPVVLDSTELRTSRSSPKREAVFSQELDPISFDPYAYFLDSTSRKKYQDRLDERGMKPEGEPDRGHPFELKRHTIFGRPRNVRKTSVFASQFFENCWVTPSIGDKLLDLHRGNVFAPAPYMETGLDAFAQQAYNRTAPTATVFDAGQFLGELREGLPRLTSAFMQGQASLLKKAGSDYLNVEFGWKPFISDIQNAGKALLGATDSFSQMGKRVHRRYSLPETELTDFGLFLGTASIYAYNARGAATNYSPLAGRPLFTSTSAQLLCDYTVHKSRSSRRWFEGEFTSFMPLGFDPTDYFQRLSVLVDPKITPATLWELAPWSWLVDWNLRIGDTIRANEINANDRLVMHYGYAMETTVYATKVDWNTYEKPSGQLTYENRPEFGILRGETTYKRRLRANPYGFRVGGTGSLSGGQSAILGALGLTKFR